MADATATKDLNKDNVKIENVGPARKRLTITVPAEVIETKINESMQTLASETVLPGFRKGHVPSGLLQRRFGGAVKSETKNQIIADAYATAIEEYELKPIGEPEPDEGLENLEIEEGKPLQFSLEVEVVPDFELPSLDGIEIKRPVIEIADEHLDAEVTRIQRELGAPSPVEGKFQEEDRLTGSVVVTSKDKDEPVHEQEQVTIIYPAKTDEGRGPVLGLMIDDLSDILKGKSVGDTITIKTTGPAAHEREDIRGAELTITFKIQEVIRITPVSTEDVVERYGLPSEEILREQIKLALEQRRNEEQAGAMRDQATRQLADQVDFDLPKNLTAAQSFRQLERFKLQLQYQGLSADNVEAKVAEARSNSEEEARSSLKMFFLLQRLAEHFKVEVTEQEINSRIAMIASQQGMRPDKLKNELVQNNRLNELASQIRDMKAADRLVSESKITDVTLEEWNAFISGDAGKSKPAADKGKKKTTKKAGSKKTPSKKKTPAKK